MKKSHYEKMHTRNVYETFDMPKCEYEIAVVQNEDKGVIGKSLQIKKREYDTVLRCSDFKMENIIASGNLSLLKESSLNFSDGNETKLNEFENKIEELCGQVDQK